MTLVGPPIDTLSTTRHVRAGGPSGVDGARIGVVIAAGVAAWAAARLALGDADAADVAPLHEAVAWTGEFADIPRGLPLAAPALLLAGYVVAAALAGWALASAFGRGSPAGRGRLAGLAVVLAAEYALWRLAGWHTGPWLRAAIWYHIATVALTVVVVLERVSRTPVRPPRWPSGRLRPAPRLQARSAALGPPGSVSAGSRLVGLRAVASAPGILRGEGR